MLIGLAILAVAVLLGLVLLMKSSRPRRSLVDEEEAAADEEADAHAAADHDRDFDREDDDADDGEAAVLPIEDSIDLHGFAPRDIPDVVESYLEAAVERGFDEVRLIHGRGKGVQRARVREVLREHPAVIDFHDAPATRGGYGATVVALKR